MESQLSISRSRSDFYGKQGEDMAEAEDRSEPEAENSQPPPKTIGAEELFQGAREVWIELDGVRYRLRITRRNKLILQK